MEAVRILVLVAFVLAGSVSGGFVGVRVSNWLDPQYRAAVRLCDEQNDGIRRGVQPGGLWGTADHDGAEPYWSRVEWHPHGGWTVVTHARRAN